MTKHFCLTNDVNSPIYQLAEKTETLIDKHMSELLVAPGTYNIQIFSSPDTKLNIHHRIIEVKPLMTGWYLLKVLLEIGECISFNQHNFNKSNNPVRNFTENFILKKVSDKRTSDMERVYSVDGLLPKYKTGFPIDALPLFARDVSNKFFENLVGKDNLATYTHTDAKIKIIWKNDAKPTKGSFYNSVLYLFKEVGDCELLKPADINDIDDDQIVFRYSFSKNVLFIYQRDKELVHEFVNTLRTIENSGQEDFYIKPDLRRADPSYCYGFIEPVIK